MRIYDFKAEFIRFVGTAWRAGGDAFPKYSPASSAALKV
jgi:hypothetical protein